MTKLYDANDGITGRDGGVYLDQVERERAEEARARVEGREPDYDNPGGTAGTVYVTADQLLAHRTLNHSPSQSSKFDVTSDDIVTAYAADDKHDLKVAFDAPDVPDTDEEEDKKEEEKTPVAKKAAPTTASSSSSSSSK